MHHKTIKMKPINVKTSTSIDFDVETSDKDPKFKVGDHVRLSKCKNILRKIPLKIGQKKCFLLKS